MGRLTKRVKSNVPPLVLKMLDIEEVPTEDVEIIKADSDTCNSVCEQYECSECPINEAFEKLAHYEDLEEQGRLIELPCAVGDTVYVVGEYGIGGVKEYEVGCIVLKGNADYSRCLWEDVYGGGIGNFEDIGKVVFLTKEEAEAKLAELKGE